MLEDERLVDGLLVEGAGLAPRPQHELAIFIGRPVRGGEVGRPAELGGRSSATTKQRGADGSRAERGDEIAPRDFILVHAEPIIVVTRDTRGLADTLEGLGTREDGVVSV
jgi:hypothetical protein